MANPITFMIIKALTLKGKFDVKDLRNHCKNSKTINENLLLKLVSDNKNTEYGKKYHFDQIHSIEDYQRVVPFSTFDDYAPYIDRMTKNKEKNLLTAYKVVQYAETSGSIGVPKKIPVTDKSMKIYEKYTISRVTYLANERLKKTKNHSLPIGRGFNMLEIYDRYLDDGTPLGNISGSAAKGYKALFPFYLTSPNPVLFPKGYMDMVYLKLRYALMEKDMSFMFSVFMTTLVDMMNYLEKNWKLVVDDIRNGTIHKDIKMDDDVRTELLKITKPMPKRADELEKEFLKGFDSPIIPRIWKKLSFICAIGTGSFASYTEKMRKYSGDVLIDFSIYGASEGMMAACTEIETPAFALLPDSCFYEFIPASNNEANPKTLTLDQLKQGEEYEIVITNLCGFYRYRIKDVVRVVDFQDGNPRITFSYRKSQLLDLAGDKITETQMDHAIKEFSNEVGVPVYDYCAYPNRDKSPAHYDFLIEPDGYLDPKKCDEYRDILEEKLYKSNPVYKECVDTKEIEHATVAISQPQTHALWREYKIFKGATSAQVKPVRVLDTPQKQKFFFNLIEK